MTRDLTSGNPLKAILFFTMPLMLGNLFQQFYSLADTIIVGRFVSVEALAAVGSTGAVNFLILGFAIGSCCGFAIPVAQRFGAKDEKDMRRYIINSAWLCIGLAAVMTVATVLLTRPILRLMQTPEDILDNAALYIGWIFAGLPFVFLYNMVAAIMRALGDSKTPLYFLLLTSGLNIVLDLIFILQFHMGVFGAALATDVSQAVSGVLSFFYLIEKFKVLRPQPGESALNKSICIKLCAVGMPMGLQYSITAIGSVIMQSAVNMLGSVAVAAVTAASRTSNLLTSPYESLGTAMATYAGQNLGANKMDRIRKGLRGAQLISAVYTVMAVGLVKLFSKQILALFLDVEAQPEIVAQAQTYLWWNTVFFLSLGILIILRYCIQGVGYSNLAMLSGVSEMVARTIVAITFVPRMGFMGACLSNPLAWVAADLFLVPAYLWTMNALQNRLAANALKMKKE